MDAPEHRGFQFQAYEPAEAPPRKRGLRAVRGCISLSVEGTVGDLPDGWRLTDVLRYEIDRLMDPARLRHVEHLN